MYVRFWLQPTHQLILEGNLLDAIRINRFISSERTWILWFPRFQRLQRNMVIIRNSILKSGSILRIIPLRQSLRQQWKHTALTSLVKLLIRKLDRKMSTDVSNESMKWLNMQKQTIRNVFALLLVSLVRGRHWLVLMWLQRTLIRVRRILACIFQATVHWLKFFRRH